MTFQRWWYDAEQRGTWHHRKEYRNRGKTRRWSSAKLFLVAPLLLVLSVAAIYHSNLHASSNPSVHATLRVSAGSSVGPLVGPLATVFVAPSNVALLTQGSTFTVRVQVSNMPQFNGWDIQISTFPTVINATSLSITGNDFAVNASSVPSFELVHCVNAVGTGCTSSDGPGIVHSALGSSAILTGNGLLFTVTYKVTTSYLYSPIGLQNDLIADPSSGNGVAHSSLNGVYGTQPTTIGGGGGAAPRQE